MKHKSFWKEIRRSMTHSLGRILAITSIVALGAGFLAGLSASEPDMKLTADHYFEETKYMDVKIQSTLGLTEEDIEAIRQTEGVKSVMPSHMLDLSTSISGMEGEKVVRFSGLPEELNQLVLLEGRMPERDGECLLNPGKITMDGVQVGDRLTVQEDGLKARVYTVVGLVNSAQYLSLTLGSTTKGSGSLSYVAYLPEDQFDQEYYTIAYIQAAGLEGISAFTPEYDGRIEELTTKLEQTGTRQAQLRYDEMMEEAAGLLADARSEYEEEKEKVDEQLSEAGEQLLESEKEMQAGQQKLESGEQQFIQGSSQLESAWASYQISLERFEENRDYTYETLAENRRQLDERQQQLAQARTQWQSKGEELSAAKAQLDPIGETLAAAKEDLEQKSAAMEEERLRLEQAYGELEAAKPELPEEEYQQALDQWQAASDEFFRQQTELAGAYQNWQTQQSDYDEQLGQWQEGWGAYEAAGQKLDAREEELDQGYQKLAETEAAVESQLTAAEQQLANVKETLLAKEAQLEESEEELEQGKEELKTAQKQIEQGQEELEKAQGQAQEELSKAMQQIREGEDKLGDIPKAQWYVLDRHMEESFVSYSNDAERMGKIATVFPWMFFIVAALVSLTTMTRMVEEERMLIGTYKALGFSTNRIMAKYLIYAGSASLLGAAVGIAVGFQVLPRVVCKAYGTMYMLPETQVRFYWEKAVMAGGAALICTIGATIAACLHSLRSRPAQLMQPEAPKAGKRILLERIRPLWRHMSFTKKVTARNLFRYKKRLFMTVIGIAGCTGLLLTGFGLKDSIMDIVQNQYHHVYSYDGILGVKDEEKSRLSVESSQTMADYLYVSSKMADVQSEQGTVTAYLYVPETEERLNDFIRFETRIGEKPVPFDEDHIVITEKMADRLGVDVGSVISLKDSGGMNVALTVGGITENYLHNYVYLPRHVYEDTLGYQLEFNQILFKAKAADAANSGEAAAEEQAERVRQELTGAEGIATVQLLDDIQEPLRKMIRSLNLVVMVLIVSAGLLAFIVLYNLTNINITERQREIATIKVLGFHPKEVSAYIYRETMILTLIGCLAGLLVGIVMHRFVVTTVEVDMVMFGRSIHGIHYLWSAVMTLLFSVFVNFVMYFKLKKVNMVESLKSVE